jgi:hypothetical protein
LQLRVGPVTSIQFPFILLDRALIFYAHAINWAHGRRGRREEERPRKDDRSYVTAFTSEQRSLCSSFFQAVRSSNEKKYEYARQKMIDMLKEVLADISHREIA